MADSPTYEALETRIKILESKIIELYSPASDVQNLWSAVFDQFDEFVFQLDRNNRIENANQAVLKYLNKNKAEIFGLLFEELFSTLSNNNISELLSTNNERKISKEIKIIKTNESYQLNCYNIEHFQKKILIFQKIAEIADENLQNENNKDLNFIDNLPEGIIRTDISGNITFINKAACNIIEITCEDVIAKNINEALVLHNNIFFSNADSLIKYLVSEGTGQRFINNTSIETPYGIKEILFSITSEKDENEAFKGFIITIIDYTDKHQKEKELRENEERLYLQFDQTKSSVFNESKTIFLQKLNSGFFKEKDKNNLYLLDFISKEALQRLQDEFSYAAKIASVILDENGNPITTASNFSSVCKILLPRKKSDEKCNFLDLALHNGVVKSIFEANKCEYCDIIIKNIPVIAGGKEIAKWVCGFVDIKRHGKQIPRDFQKILNHSKEEIKHLLEINPPITRENIEKITNLLWQLCQQLSSFAYDCFNMAEEHFARKNLLTELIEARKKAEEADKYKTAFLASMSHEIRTPMNAIIGFADLLSDPDFSENEKSEFINLINNNGEILLHLIDDIIDIAKIETGEIRIEHSECDINAIIQETAMEARDHLKKSGKDSIEVKTVIPETSEYFAIITDPFRFKQILTNLVGNAQKFTNTGSIEIGYQIKSNQTLSGEELFLEFYVKDTGIGIPEEKQSIIFDRFKQADEKVWVKFGGSGLGLTISQRLVKILGGDIWVDSYPGKGSTFYFTLPYIRVDANIKTQHPDYQFIENINLEGKTILVVEDIASNFILVRTLLSKNNAQIIWAKDGKQAVDVCRNKTIDLVLMDIKLPELNGLIATQRIKEMHKKIPIIAITAYARDDDRLAALQAGCNDYISKPIKRERLLYLISRYLNQ